MSMGNHNNIGRGSPDSSTRALWQSYQQRCLVAHQEELYEEFGLQNIFYSFFEVIFDMS
jgi:hypothetical protein